MNFDTIEQIVEAKLPPSACKYRAWWSSNPTNSVLTHTWLDAGMTWRLHKGLRSPAESLIKLGGDRSPAYRAE